MIRGPKSFLLVSKLKKKVFKEGPHIMNNILHIIYVEKANYFLNLKMCFSEIMRAYILFMQFITKIKIVDTGIRPFFSSRDINMEIVIQEWQIFEPLLKISIQEIYSITQEPRWLIQHLSSMTHFPILIL